MVERRFRSEDDGDGGRLLVLFAMTARAPQSGQIDRHFLRLNLHYRNCHNLSAVRGWVVEKMNPLGRKYVNIKERQKCRGEEVLKRNPLLR